MNKECKRACAVLWNKLKGNKNLKLSADDVRGKDIVITFYALRCTYFGLLELTPEKYNQLLEDEQFKRAASIAAERYAKEYV